MKTIAFAMSLLSTLGSFTANAASFEFDIDGASMRVSSDFDDVDTVVYPLPLPMPEPMPRREVRVWHRVDDWGTMREVAAPQREAAHWETPHWDAPHWDRPRVITVYERPAPRWHRTEPLPVRRPHYRQPRMHDDFDHADRLPSKTFEQVDLNEPYREF